MINQMNRRILLKGLGGAVVAAPFLSSLFERSAKGQAAAAPMKRVIVMFTHYGCITNKWFPANLNGPLTSADLTATSLAALAPMAAKLMIPRGIRTMNEWTANNTGPGKGRGQGNDSHTQIVGSAFTCQPVTPNSNNPFSFDQSTKFQAMPAGPSLDHVMAQQLSDKGAPLFMNVSGQSKESPQSAISYSAKDTIFTAQTATQAYSALTGLFSSSTPMNADTYASLKGKKIADIVKADLNRLLTMDMSKDDKDKLNAWLALANDVSTIVASAACGQDLATSLGASNKIGQKTSTDDALTHKINDTMDNADLYSAIAALTAACDANPVIFLKYPNNYIFTGLGINADSHNQSHRLGDASMSGACVSDAVDHLIKIDTYYAQKFANLIGYLDKIPEGGKTVLDNSVAIWMNEMSDGNAHNLNNAPIIQAGSAGGYFKTGQVINLDSTLTADNHLGRSLSQCYMGNTTMANGVNQGTGTDAAYGNMPVNKYFCNIMNAMGMKADASGFPAKDGPASEVTHYGYSDNTVDFTGGLGAETPVFKSPGAFTELKA